MRSVHPPARPIRRPALLVSLVVLGGLLAGLFVIGAAGLNDVSAQADVTGPSTKDRRIALIVNSLLKTEHLSKRRMDDTISQRAFDSFLKSLDPMKLYFFQSDVDELAVNRDKIDDMIEQGDLTFAYQVYQRFLKRVEERSALIEGMLKENKFDFAVDEEIVTDPKATTYAKGAEEIRQRWHRRLKRDLLILKADEVTGDEAIDRLQRRYRSISRRWQQTSNDDLLELYLTSITSSYDPHTNYMSASTLENFRIQMRKNLEGIGAALQLTDGYTVVSKLIPGGAADKAGELKPEDRVVAVGQGENGEMVDVVDMKLNDVVDLIRGPAGTIVRLKVIPAGTNDPKTYKITRAKVELDDSKARSVIYEAGKKPNGEPYKVGVIDLPDFYMDMEGARDNLNGYTSSTRDVRKILDDFNSKSIDAVVLDLRRNGGGSLTEAINLTGLFIDRGPVVQVKDSDNQVQDYQDLERGMAWSGPLVVVTSKFSASASEILAGAIQDYQRGIVVGDPATHGKGTVQSLLDLGGQVFRIPNPPNLGALKITMQQFYRPNGESTQKHGVKADVVLPSLTSQMDVAEGDLDYAIEFDQIPAARYSTVNMVNGAIVQKLRSRSGERIAQSEEFKKLQRNIERYVEQKAKKSVTLHEEKFFAERKELNAEKEEEKQFEEQINPSGAVVKRDFYFNEVLDIAADYVGLLGEKPIAQAR